MSAAERNLNHLLMCLRAVIGRSGVTRDEIEASLGWRPERTERLLDRRESIDVGEVVAILGVVGVEPADFFTETFPLEASPATSAEVTH